jgi:hypothetical protein
MNAPKPPQDRRQDTRQRLRIAVRKAHDRMFALLKSPPGEKRGDPTPR